VEILRHRGHASELLDSHGAPLRNSLTFERTTEVLASREPDSLRLRVDRCENLVRNVSDENVRVMYASR
jgi:hypothetical protein